MFLRRLALLLAVTLILAGCATQPTQSTAQDVILVISPTTGSPAVDQQIVRSELDRLSATGDRLIVVVADGEPSVVVDMTVGTLSGNGDERRSELRSLRALAAASVTDKTATTAEVNLSEAIALGARSARPEAHSTMTILASGVQTTGMLSLTEGRLYAEPSVLVTAAEQAGAVANLSAVDVVRMPRIGVTTEPQPSLDEPARTALTAIWTEFFTVAGAPNADLSVTNASAGEPMPSLPFVTPVPIERPRPGAVADCRQELGTDAIGFAAASAELSDAAFVESTLRQTHAALAGCVGEWLVEGSASSEGDGSANQVLSEQRAEAIAAVLRRIDPSASVRVVGWGTAWPCRVTDLDAAGHLIIDAAIKNRVVVVSRGVDHC